MKEAFEEFKYKAREEIELISNDISDKELKQLFVIAFLAGQKAGLLEGLEIY